MTQLHLRWEGVTYDVGVPQGVDAGMKRIAERLKQSYWLHVASLLVTRLLFVGTEQARSQQQLDIEAQASAGKPPHQEGFLPMFLLFCPVRY